MTAALHAQLQQALGDAYTLERELGGGGMSHVFVATEKALGRQVVVKVLPAEMAGQVSVERFKREISLAARLQHPHIVPLLTAGHAGDLPFFTMPLVEGESLRARLVRQGELPLSEAIRLLREIASALAYAHERGIVHRDIKPDNVLLSGGSAMVTDFGVAKALSASSNGEASGMTSLGVALGTPAYMSPEQATADPAVDHRADIYAFGVLAYELLTGQPPFSGRTPQNLLAAHVTEAPDHVTKRRGSIPPALGALVMRCLEKRAADRPQQAMDLVHALDQINTPSGGTNPTNAQLAFSAAPSLPMAPTGMAAAASRKWMAIAVALVVVIGGAWFAATRRSSGSAMRSIAVLPMDLGGDTAHAYLSDGLSNELTTKLSKIPGLAVRAYSSARTMRGRTVREAGKELGVASLLTSSMIRSGSRLRITASVVNAADDNVIWSDTFEESDQDQFSLQDKLVSAIAGALKLTLSPETKAAVAVRGTRSNEAHELVQRSRFETDRFTQESLRSAIALAEAAIAKDSSYADAWAALADAWGTLADDFVSPREAVPHMRRAIAKALALDPTLAEAHAQLGTMLMWYDHDADAAAKELERALVMDSSNVSAAASYRDLLARARDLPDSATAVLERALRLNPSAPYLLGPATSIGALRRVSADVAQARCQALTRVTTRKGGCEARRLFVAGRRPEAIAMMRGAIAPTATGSAHIQFASALWDMADTAGARQELAAALEAAKREYVREDMIATMYFRLGERERSIEWWQKSGESGGAQLIWLATDKEFAPLRTDPRIQAVIKAGRVP